MMPGMPGQFFQPGMQNYPMMQQPMMMAQGVAPQMYPMQQIPMVRPQSAPPPYTSHLAEAYKAKSGFSGTASRQRSHGPPMSEEEIRKAQYFQAQQQRLKQFGKGVPQTTFIPDDPTKLVDSIFGTNSVKSKPKPTMTHEKPVVTQSKVDDDDGFGDFMEGPSVITTSVTNTEQHSVISQVIHQQTVEPQSPTSLGPQCPQAEKKDLMSMMMECSDLNQPAKAKHFQKPSLKEVHVTHAHNKTFQQSGQSRCWTSTDELIGLFKSEIQSQPPPKQVKVRRPSGSKHVATTSAGLPLWVEATDENLPAVYRQVLEAASGLNGIETAKLYPILLLSGLPREVLGSIWQLANRENPGQVTRSELFAILALIALAQNNYSVASLEILTRCPQPPVPFLGQNAIAPAPGPDPAIAPAGVVNSAVPSQPLHAVSQVMPGTVPVPESQIHLQGLPAHAGPVLPDTAAVLGMGPVLAAHPASLPALQSIPMTDTVAQQCPPVTMTSAVNSVAAPASVHHPSDGLPQSNLSGFPVPPSQPVQVLGSSQNQTVSLAPPYSSVVQTSNQLADNDDDDFADFQTAADVAKKTDDSFGDFIGSDKKPPVKQDSLYDVSTAASSIEIEQVSYDDKYNSNIRSFFCSSDSSTGHTTPNSLEDDFTDCRDSSQLSTSEQSENEDIKVFESYVEEFNRKKDQQNFSPLHRPIARRPPATANLPTSIPSVPPVPPPTNLTGDDFTDFKVAPVFTQKVPTQHPAVASKDTLLHAAKMLEVVSAVQPGDDDFSDFQEAPVKEGDKMKPSSSGWNLLGEEDKYSALRIVEETTVIPSIFNQDADDDVDGGFANFEEAEKDNNEWAAFAEAEPAQPSADDTKDGTQDSLSVPPGLTSAGSVSQLRDEVYPAGLKSVESAPVLGSITGSESKSPLDTSAFFGAVPSLNESPRTSVEKASILSLYGSAEGRKDEDEWADFEAAPVPSSDNALSKSTFSVAAPTPQMGHTLLPDAESNKILFSSDTSDKTSHLAGVHDKNTVADRFGEVNQINNVHPQDNQLDKADGSLPQFSTSSLRGSFANSSEILTVKKTNLPSDEIMGVFKIREDPSVLARLRRPSKPTPEQQPQAHRAPSQESDIDDDRLPPPMDFPDDDEDHIVFSRGYDGLDEIVNKPVVTTSYNPYGLSNSSHLYMTSSMANNKHMTKTASSGLSSGGLSSDGLGSGGVGSGGLNMNMGRPAQIHPGLAGERPDDNESSSSKDQDSWTWKERQDGSREDSQSISSLDLNQRLAVLHKDSDSGGTDSQSVSSAEFGNFEGLSREMAESKSVDSLDLKNEPQPDDESAGYPGTQAPNPVTGSSFTPVVAQNLVISGRMRPLADRYNIGDEVQDNNNHEYAWERCLDNCCRMIQDANTVFNSVSSSSVCNEVIRSSQGAEYVTGIAEIYKVVCRIMATMMSCGIKTPTLEKLLKEIDLSWNNLTAFLMGSSILPDPNTLDFFHATIKSASELSQEKSCGVCLLNVDVKDRSLADENGVVKLMYGGRQYHAPCANFWVNCVDSTLPALRLPELL
ncbi:synergin gamma-like isoform X2 [Gigantopelta aegis]|uniref:synergin gamma-like isoform X2 n=1 Tax=Gigantopelta aegis TaxID=1735272 RepID=UPI001B88890F|nr:synergin gamma-like isoform X2 [Gigantopelta aegis]